MYWGQTSDWEEEKECGGEEPKEREEQNTGGRAQDLTLGLGERNPERAFKGGAGPGLATRMLIGPGSFRGVGALSVYLSLPLSATRTRA